MSNKVGSKQGNFTLSFENSVAIVEIDVKGESQNVLQASFVEEITAVLDEIEASEVAGVILTSAKPDTFIAGADINMLKSLTTREAIAEVTQAGYAIFDRIENFKVPVVAEVHGPCIGGGLELSLACHGRVGSKASITKFALPEVQLGLLPGGGGTQRLPALVGIVDALTMMTTGKQIPSRNALKMGLIDAAVEQSYLRQASMDLIEKLKRKQIKRGELARKDWFNTGKATNHVLNNYGLKMAFVRDYILDKARKQVMAKTKGKYPAPLKIIDCVESWARDSRSKGFETEAKGFADLVLSPQAKQLMNLFFAITDLKKARFISSRTKPKEITRLGVVGGGLMGSGIALVSAEKAKVPVRVQEMNEESLDRCMQYSWKHLQSKVQKRRLKKPEAMTIQGRITGTLDYSGFSKAELVIEAAFESLEVKHDVIKQIEANSPKDVIIATNTSSIPIAEIAKVAKKPENVIGMHYFSPVEKMPLLEIIKTDQTSDKAITTAVEFGRKQGKTVIVVSDGAGFYTSRILAAYMNEAAYLLSEGVPVERIDKAMLEFGFPVGPFTLLDEVGIDVATKIMPVLQEAFGERLQAPECFAQLKSTGRLGKKDKRGFYDYNYDGDGPRPVDKSVYKELGIEANSMMPKADIQNRLHLMMLNEASRCLEEGILDTARDGDIGAIFGLGYPPFLGGPFRFMDTEGLESIAEQLQALVDKGHKRFEPSDLIRAKSSEKSCYY
jgi:3-hydroxyacyl-CoA dehydrogenase/enoyl-CoA hydratase/3-hydroxybutyryl-CoA epimerase